MSSACQRLIAAAALGLVVATAVPAAAQRACPHQEGDRDRITRTLQSANSCQTSYDLMNACRSNSGGDVELAEIVIQRAMLHRHAKSFMLVGLRGVGKTVLLNRICQMAEAHGMRWHMIESPEEKPLPELLVPALRRLLLSLDNIANVGDAVRRGLRVLASFAKSVKVKYEGVEVGVDVEKGVADSGDLESDLADLFVAIGEAAKARRTAAMLVIDELQYVEEKALGALREETA